MHSPPIPSYESPNCTASILKECSPVPKRKPIKETFQILLQVLPTAPTRPPSPDIRIQSHTHLHNRHTGTAKTGSLNGAPPPLSEKTALKSSFLPRTLKLGSAPVGFCTLSFLFKYLQFPSWMMGPVGLHHRGAYQLSSSLPLSFFRS